jgi:hypothetical protein
MGAQLIRKFSILNGTWSFITKLTRLPSNCLLSRLYPVHTLLLHFFKVYLKIIYLLYQRLQNSLFCWSFPTKILDSTLVHVCYIFRPSFDFILLVIFCAEHKVWYFSLCTSPHPPPKLSLLSPNYLGILFSQISSMYCLPLEWNTKFNSCK